MSLPAASRRVGAGLLIAAAAVLLPSASALAETKTFTNQGCEKWEVPPGVSSVTIQATGAAGGQSEFVGVTGEGGKGDGYSAMLSGLSAGEPLFVCVEKGSGAGGNTAGGFNGGQGGGASGVSRGSTFASPMLVAAAGGGAATFASPTNQGNGGNAGESGQDGSGGTGGKPGTLKEGGAGGTGPTSGEKGSASTSEGPGAGGTGAPGIDPKGNSAAAGGGGGGYFGGGGGGSGTPGGGGGGGSDFCGNGATSCERHAQAGTKHEAGEAEGDAKVTLTYVKSSATCGKTTIGKVADQLLANQKRVNRCVLPFNAQVTELVTYLAPTSHSGEQLIKGIFYEDSKGKPGKLLGETSQLKFSSKEAAGWYHFAFVPPLKLSAGSYWMGIITGASSKVAGERFDSVPKAEDYNTNSYLSGASDPFGSFKTTNEEMSLYATFEEAPPQCAAVGLLKIC
jgi:hypothetical protein